MSQGNVKRVREGFEQFLAGDVQAWLDGLHPDVEWHMAEDEPDARIRHGHDDVLALLAETVQTFSSFQFQVHEILDAGDSVIVVTTMRGVGKGSGAEVALPETLVFDLHEDGRAWRVREYRHKEQALEAVGALE